MLSVIVAVHNQSGHNMLFLEGIRRHTTGPYEVIVVDNHSQSLRNGIHRSVYSIVRHELMVLGEQ